MSYSPSTDVQTWKGTAPNALQSGRVDAYIDATQKSGYSLTAGSYSVRASNTQQGTITVPNGSTTNSAAISTVTTTRAVTNNTGSSGGPPSTTNFYAYLTLASASVTATRGDGSNGIVVGFNVQELF